MILKMMNMDTQSGYVITSILLIFALFISSFGVTVIGDNVKCIESEGHALLPFKHGLQDLYGKLSSWKYENVEDCCNWRGVKCSNLTGHIIKLYLRFTDFLKSLSGNIGHSLLQLSYLNYLDLSYNGFEGSIPNYIGSLVNLKYLNLSHNWFSGIIPQHIDNLSSLLTLDLYGLNEVKNSKSLEWLSHLSSLQYLDLSIVNLENASDWLQVVNKLPLLQTLILSACELPPPILPSYDPYINISTSLSKLDLSINHLTSSIFLWLSNFNTSLVYLDLSVNNLQGYIPNAFGNLTSLSYIDFHLPSNWIPPLSEIPVSLSQISSLSVLDLSYNKLSGKIPIGTQLQSFNDTSYVGNLGLCGSPLPKCREEEMVPNSNDKKYEANKNEFTSQGFYISIVVRFVVGFSGICASLIFLRSWRHVYFGFLSFLNDWFYVKIKIYMNKMEKLFKG